MRDRFVRDAFVRAACLGDADACVGDVSVSGDACVMDIGHCTCVMDACVRDTCVRDTCVRDTCGFRQ